MENIRNATPWAGGTQCERCFCQAQGLALCFFPNVHPMLSAALDVCNPSMSKTESGGFLLACQLGQAGEIQAHER